MNAGIIINGLVLAGGQSSRMGQDKSQLLWHQVPLYQHMTALLDRGGMNPVLVSSNQLSGNNVIADRISDKGPLSGIHAAMAEISDGEFLLIVPVDMPLLPVEALMILGAQREACCFRNYTLPLLLPVNPESRALVEQRINSAQHRDYSLWRLHQKLQGITLELPESMADAFGNANTPEDWRKCQALGEINSGV